MMELLRKYINDIGQDLVLDDFNLKEAQMRLPARKHFWVARLMEAKIKRNSLIRDKKTININIAEQDAIIEYLEKVEKILGNMHWEIKNIIEINKMEQL